MISMKIAGLAKVRKTAKNGGELRFFVIIGYKRSYKNEKRKKDEKNIFYSKIFGTLRKVCYNSFCGARLVGVELEC